MEGLDNKELKCLLIIFEKIRIEYEKIFEDFTKVNEQVQTKKENILYLRETMDNEIEENQNEEIKTSQQYQKEEAFSIEKEYFNTRVRDVHYRNQKIKVLKRLPDGVVKQIGYCIDKDFPLEVLKIPKLYQDFEKQEVMLNSLNALKELIFSKYFQKYLGFNTVDEEYDQYFLSYEKSIRLDKLLQQTEYKLNPDLSLYNLWIREIFKAFKDILDKTTYCPALPITLKNIYISDKGLKVTMKNIEFPNFRQNIEQSHEFVEAKLLKNFGKLILNILGIQEYDYKKLQELDKYSSDFKNFIEGLLSAKDELKKFMKKQFSQPLQFQKFQNLPYLHDDFMITVDVLQIVQDYEKIFESQ